MCVYDIISKMMFYQLFVAAYSVKDELCQLSILSGCTQRLFSFQSLIFFFFFFSFFLFVYVFFFYCLQFCWSQIKTVLLPIVSQLYSILISRLDCVFLTCILLSWNYWIGFYVYYIYRFNSLKDNSWDIIFDEFFIFILLFFAKM